MVRNLGDETDGHVQVGLLDEFADTPAGKWSRGRCFPLVKGSGLSPEELARKVLIVEFHGYHSKASRPLPITLPSQEYGFWLVSQAVERGATVVIMRATPDWKIAVPALSSAEAVLLSNPQNASISPGNCLAGGFERVLAALG
jgi:hypothetical protein